MKTVLKLVLVLAAAAAIPACDDYGRNNGNGNDRRTPNSPSAPANPQNPSGPNP